MNIFNLLPKFGRRAAIIEALNKAVEIFTLHYEKSFNDVMTNGIRQIADAAHLDRVTIYTRLKSDWNTFGQLYRWDRTEGGTTAVDKRLNALSVNIPAVARWVDTLSKGKHIIRRIDSMSKDELAFVNVFDMKSLILIPIFTHGELWGAVSFQDHTHERNFDNSYIDLLYSAARICAGATIREELRLNNEIALKKLEQRKKMSNALNESTIVFISHNEKMFETRMTAGVRLIADAIGFTRMSVWRNFKADDGLHTSQIYRWDKHDGGTTKPVAELSDVVYSKFVPRWYELFADNKSINEIARNMPEAAMLKSYGVVSLFVQPLIIENVFWGFAVFEDNTSEHVFEKEQVEVMYSAAYLCSNVIIHSEMEQSIKTAIDNANYANKVKDEFLFKISHEIRTPMNAIIGITEFHLQDESLPQRLKEGLTTIYNSSGLLLRLTNDILDLSKIEAGKLEITPNTYEVANLINDTVQLNIMQIESKPIEFKLKIDENIPYQLYGDELRIKQILNNLLSNAFKNTERGEITIYIYTEKAEGCSKSADTVLVFRISDTGQGMTDEKVHKVFDEHANFKNNPSEGSVFGMNITQSLIQMMNGNLSAQSELGKGTTVTVRLPQKDMRTGVLGKKLAEDLQLFRINSTSQLRRAQVIHEPMPYGSVLVVDDVDANLYVTKKFLQPYDLSIETVSSGIEAIEKVKEGNVYDIIFMDYMMPKMNGIEATKVIRDLGYTQPVVALTANAVKGEEEIFLKNGFDSFISKPVDTRQLNIELNKFIRDKQSPEVIKEARNQKTKTVQLSQVTYEVDAALLTIFARDAKRALVTFENTLKNLAKVTSSDLHLFAVNAHAMKGALANIGGTTLSQIALDLEKAGKEQDMDTIKSQTQDMINVLRAIVTKIELEKSKKTAIKDGDPAYLHEQLKAISEACANYNEKHATVALKSLGKMPWTNETERVLEKISEYILHSDFEEAKAEAEKYMKELKI